MMAMEDNFDEQSYKISLAPLIATSKATDKAFTNTNEAEKVSLSNSIKTHSDANISRIIEMAWEDRTFKVYFVQCG